MIDRNVFSHNAQEPETCRLEACIDACREHVNHILSEVISSQHQEAHRVEASLCKQLMQLGFLLLALFFVNYHDGDYGETTSLAPLDRLLNLPTQCYSYFLAERVNLLTIQDAYEEAVHLLQRLFDLTLSVSAAETISQQSADHYDVYYA